VPLGSAPDPEIYRVVPNGTVDKHPVSPETPGMPYGPAMALGSILTVALSSMALTVMYCGVPLGVKR